MKRVAIIQSNYIPWKGYFDLINAVDEFVLYDDVQYTRSDWRNRNRIKTPTGLAWLTIPVTSSLLAPRAIVDTEIVGNGWASKHWRSLQQNYARSPYLKDYADEVEDLYLGRRWTYLSAVSEAFLAWCLEKLAIQTLVTRSSEYERVAGRSERLVGICQQCGADVYVSGSAAKSYLDEALFDRAGIRVEWFEYPSYPEYPQPWGEFVHGVSALDLIFNTGPDARSFRAASRTDG